MPEPSPREIRTAEDATKWIKRIVLYTVPALAIVVGIVWYGADSFWGSWAWAGRITVAAVAFLLFLFDYFVMARWIGRAQAQRTAQVP